MKQTGGETFARLWCTQLPATLRFSRAHLQRCLCSWAALTGARAAPEDSSPCESPVIAARFPGVDASGLAKRLRERRVVVSARHGFLRVSTHFYNNEEDLQAFARALRECI
jgi:selenocysteine lyase/cysteine desulfurase